MSDPEMTNKKSLSQRMRDLFEDVRCDSEDYGPLVAEVERFETSTILRDQIDSLMAQVSKLSAENAQLRSRVEPPAGPTDWEHARDVVANVVRGLGGEARVGATLALDAISEAMIGTRASENR